MKVGYVVSMFPCWSETFILNELIDHFNNGLDQNIFSLKNCSENMVHDEAIPFISKTVYPIHLLNPILWFLHALFIIIHPKIYCHIFAQIAMMYTKNYALIINFSRNFQR